MKLKLFLLLSWTLITVVTWKAVTLLGINWPSVFFGDILNHPWRAQFNIDFLIHLILFASWVVWRERSKITGAICGFLCIFGGGLFGFLYLLFISFQSKGNASTFFMGMHNTHQIN
ncbi:MAG: hypothetical protein AB8B92_00330 [Gammaproteobacteria bacterium]